MCNSYEVASIIVFLFTDGKNKQTKKPKHREAMQLAQCKTASIPQSPELDKAIRFQKLCYQPPFLCYMNEYPALCDALLDSKT